VGRRLDRPAPATLLEVHAAAEEAVFYPHLLKLGTGAGGKGSAASEVRDGIKDHNEIRDAAADVDRQHVGSDVWWQAVIKARAVNSDHMAEEDLADFRRTAPTPPAARPSGSACPWSSAWNSRSPRY